MRRLRILHVTSTPRGMGGVERLLVDMAPHYDLTQFDVRHCNLFDATGGEGPFPRALKATGLAYVGIEGLGQIVAPLVDPLLGGNLARYRSIRAATLAEAILALAHEKARGRFVHEWPSLERALKRQAFQASLRQQVAVE